MRPLLLLGLSLTVLGACAYPRRSPALSSVAPAEAANVRAPEAVTRLRFVSAEIPLRQRGDLPWDDEGSEADALVRVYRGDTLLYESEPVRDSVRPTFDFVTDNLVLPSSADLRIELWDDDPGIPEPIGIWRGRGLPRTALPGADSRLQLEGGATLLFRVEEPEVHRGVGVVLYESRGSSLHVLDVIERSPAGRAGIRAGDDIVAIGGKTIDELGADEATGALSMAASRRSTVTFRHGDDEQTVELDGGYTWRAR